MPRPVEYTRPERTDDSVEKSTPSTVLSSTDFAVIFDMPLPVTSSTCGSQASTCSKVTGVCEVSVSAVTFV